MARMHFFYTILFIIHSIHTQQYFISKQDYLEYAAPYTDTSTKTIKVAYAINHCTKMGNHNTNTDASHAVYQCSNGGSIIYGPCIDSLQNCLSNNVQCDIDFTGVSSGGLYTTDFSSGESCPDAVATTTVNYMEVTFYCGDRVTDSRPSTCPFDNSTFSWEGVTRLATNICVAQGNGDYYMATCNNETGQIGIYDSATCDNQVGTYRNYIRSCDRYAYPNPSGNPCAYFRKVTACMVDGLDILRNTSSPTAYPTSNPSSSPTRNPSETPSASPSDVPTTATQEPSTSPSDHPSSGPTVVPTVNPSVASAAPSITPTASIPTAEPTSTTAEEPKPDQTVQGAGVILSGLDNIALMYIVCCIMLLFYIFICGYIWMNERRKRRVMLAKFQKEQDAEERAAYRKKVELQQRMEIQQQMAGIYGGYGDYDYGQQMDFGAGVEYQQMAEFKQPAPVKPVDVQLLQEGM